MALTLDDFDWKVRLPEPPKSLPLYETTAPALKERSRAMEVIGKQLGLNELRPVELPHSVVYASKRGEVEFFPASGGLWARNAELSDRYDNELRDWSGLVESRGRGDTTLAFAPDAGKRLLEQARSLFADAGLGSDAMASGAIDLDQVAELDEKGKELRRGAGSATARFAYALEGVPVFGAGAKSLAYLEPGRGQAVATGLFHAWRPITNKIGLTMTPVQDALGVGLLQDPELVEYRKRGYRLEISHLEFGYMALPATVRQTYLFPTFEIEGRAFHPDRKEDEFFFGRYHHAASPEQYQKAGA
ncbi:MAG: hypothetical protein ACREJ0_22365, partial [Geminicoccaceae bacterium]